MSVTITRTKILLPRLRPDLMSRHRLLEMLDDVLDYRLTLVSAPAGYGKTSLLIDFAHQVKYPVSWLTLDSLDQDIQRFLTHLIKSISLNFTDFGSRTLSLLENTSSLTFDLDQTIRTFVNDMYDNIPEHFAVILDDFHLVDDNQQINRFLSRLVQEMDENCHFVLSSRTLFNLPDLALMVSRSLIKSLGYEDLAFQPEEIKFLLKNNYQQHISDQESQILAKETEGWITGLLLSAEASPKDLTIHSRTAKASGVDIFDFLAEQVLNQQTPLIQDFLLKSSYLEEFNADLCKLVFGKAPKGTSWAKTITQILEKNLFVLPVDDDSTWLRYHHLFRDFLRYRSSQENPEEGKNLLRSLLTVYTNDSAWEKAYAVVRRLDDPGATAKLITQASSSLFHSGRINLLAAWLKVLPDKELENFPELFVLRGITITLMGDPLLGLAQLHMAVRHPGVLQNDKHLSRALLCRATTFRLLGRYTDAQKDALQALKLSKETGGNIMLLAEAERETGLTYQNLGGTENAQAYFRRSLKTYRSINDFKNAALVQMDLGLLLSTQGNFAEANHHYQQSLNIWLKLDNTDQQAFLMNNLGVLSHFKGHYLQAFDWFKMALQKAKLTSNLRSQAFTNASLGDLALDLFFFSAATDYYNLAHQLADTIKEGFLLSYLKLRFSALCRKSGDLTAADQHLRTAYDLVCQHSSRYELGLWHLERGRLYLAESDLPSAEEDFLNAKSLFMETSKPSDLSQSFIGLATTAFYAGKNDSVHKQLAAAVKTLLPLGTFQPILSDLYSHPELLETCRDQPAFTSIYGELENSLKSFSTNLPSLEKIISPSLDTEHDKVRLLDIHVLGQMEILYKGKILTAPDWIHQKTVRELFYYLLSLQYGASKDQIGLLFWPDSSKKQFHGQFKNTIYRLRRAIGRDSVLYDPDTRHYRFNRLLDYRYDVDVFLKACRNAEAESNTDDRARLFRDAAEKYSHPYAPLLDGVWAAPLRINLYLKFERAALESAAFDLQQGEIQTCLDACSRLLEIEPGQERAWRLSMQAYAELGDRGSIVRVYRQCRRNLSRHLGINPSKETENLYQKLLN